MSRPKRIPTSHRKTIAGGTDRHPGDRRALAGRVS